MEYALRQAETELAVRNGLWRPFLSGNDRSRWCTVRALVEPDMRVADAPYAIDKVTDVRVVDNKLKMRPGWDTIDMVWHNGHFYSSKPPLLSTLMAAEYWVIYHATGKSLGTHPYEIGRFMLITINGACLLLIFVFTARLVERLGTTDWGRILVMASCVFGTFLATFATTITNHLPAAACTAVLLEALVRIWFDGDRRTWTFIVAGFFSAMLVANEIPAALFSAAASAVILWLAPKKTLLAYLPPALLVTAAFLATNWIAVGSWKPAQMHRSEGDDWYDYPGSYWHNRQGIDQGEKSAAVYSFHVLAGHHGIFSLTPVWLLSLLGGGLWLLRGERRSATLCVYGRGSYACLPRVLHLVSVGRSQLRRQRQRVSLGLLDGANVAGAHAARGRPAEPSPLDAGSGTGALGFVHLVCQLPHMEPVDTTVDYELPGLLGVVVTVPHSFKRRCDLSIFLLPYSFEHH